MNNISSFIDMIFTDNKYQLEKLSNEMLRHYFSTNNEHFILLFISAAELNNQNCYDEAQKWYDKNKLKDNINKNCTLIIFAETDSIENINKLKVEISAIEEDEFYYKKSVILYLQKDILTLDSTNEIYSQLYSKIENTAQLKQYRDSGINDGISQYLFVLQLFIKLPFLHLKDKDITLEPLALLLENGFKSEHQLFNDYMKLNKILSDENVDISEISLETIFDEEVQ
jgi:hypothetical protein